MVRPGLPIWWAAWWIGATLLALGVIALNVLRRRRVALAEDEATRAALPTVREDVLWGLLVLMSGGAGMGLVFWLLASWHTARALLAAAIFGLIMLLGLVMLLKNGLAPTDVLLLDQTEPEAAGSFAPAPEEMAEEEVG